MQYNYICPYSCKNKDNSHVALNALQSSSVEVKFHISWYGNELWDWPDGKSQFCFFGFSVAARVLQSSAVRGPSLGLRVQSEALFSLLYSARVLQAINMSMSKGCPHLCVLCVFHCAYELARV